MSQIGIWWPSALGSSEEQCGKRASRSPCIASQFSYGARAVSCRAEGKWHAGSLANASSENARTSGACDSFTVVLKTLGVCKGQRDPKYLWGSGLR